LVCARQRVLDGCHSEIKNVCHSTYIMHHKTAGGTAPCTPASLMMVLQNHLAPFQHPYWRSPQLLLAASAQNHNQHLMSISISSVGITGTRRHSTPLLTYLSGSCNSSAVAMCTHTAPADQNDSQKEAFLAEQTCDKYRPGNLTHMFCTCVLPILLLALLVLSTLIHSMN
jgi:hypothetical protein